MFDHGAKPNPDVRADKHLLNVAARNAYAGTVKPLLESGTDPRKSIAAVNTIKRQDDWKPVI